MDAKLGGGWYCWRCIEECIHPIVDALIGEHR
jgi:hypothetical protein